MRASKDARQGAGPVSFEARFRSRLRITGIQARKTSPLGSRASSAWKDEGLTRPRKLSQHRIVGELDPAHRRILVDKSLVAGMNEHRGIDLEHDDIA